MRQIKKFPHCAEIVKTDKCVPLSSAFPQDGFVQWTGSQNSNYDPRVTSNFRQSFIWYLLKFEFLQQSNEKKEIFLFGQTLSKAIPFSNREGYQALIAFECFALLVNESIRSKHFGVLPIFFVIMYMQNVGKYQCTL